MLTMGALRRMALLLAAGLVLSACTTSGQVFQADAVGRLQPGVTTFDQAVAALGASPVDVYRAVDGSFLARWAQKYTWMTDALYWRREALLAFDAHGRFIRQQDGINIPATPATPAAAATYAGAAHNGHASALPHAAAAPSPSSVGVQASHDAMIVIGPAETAAPGAAAPQVHVVETPARIAPSGGEAGADRSRAPGSPLGGLHDAAIGQPTVTYPVPGTSS